MKLSYAIALTILFFCQPAVYAFELEPGKWGVTTTIASPMSPQPQEEYTEQCVEDSDFDPLAEMMDSQMSAMCELTVNSDTPTRLDADLTCDMPGAGTMSGNMDFQASGNSAQGKMTMSMAFNGQTINMTNTWEARYLGVCN